MTDYGEVARTVAALAERSEALSSTLETELRNLYTTMDLIQRSFSDQEPGVQAIGCLSHAQSQLLEAVEALRDVRGHTGKFVAKLLR